MSRRSSVKELDLGGQRAQEGLPGDRDLHAREAPEAVRRRAVAPEIEQEKHLLVFGEEEKHVLQESTIVGASS